MFAHFFGVLPDMVAKMAFLGKKFRYERTKSDFCIDAKSIIKRLLFVSLKLRLFGRYLAIF